jgi:sortase A
MRRIWRQIFGILALVIGLGIYLYPDYREWKLMKEVEAITETSQQENRVQNDQKNHTEPEQAPKETSASEESTETETEAETESASLDLWRALMDYNIHLAEEKQEITDAWTFRQSPVDIAALNNGSPAVGYIEIPEIELKLPLYVGATEENMSKGAVVLAGTSMPVGGNNTNCVIAGHRGYSGSPYFRDIDQLQVGSEVHINNLWESMTYKVTGTRIIHATECDILQIQPDKDMVTLFSCYPYLSVGTKYRLVIFCERAEEEEKETESETTLNETVTVRDLIEQDLQEQGIVISDPEKEELSHQEDLIRKVVPVICILLTFLLILIRLRPGKKKYSKHKKN